jgi:hypothetical protein
MAELGHLLRAWNGLEAAAAITTSSIEHSQRWDNADALAAGYVVLSRIWLAQSDVNGALDTFDRARPMPPAGQNTGPQDVPAAHMVATIPGCLFHKLGVQFDLWPGQCFRHRAVFLGSLGLLQELDLVKARHLGLGV